MTAIPSLNWTYVNFGKGFFPERQLVFDGPKSSAFTDFVTRSLKA
jgi:hypothetical protein